MTHLGMILYGVTVAVLLVVVIGLWVYIKKLKSKLAAEVQEKQQIISIISHDIKAPFNRIFALMQLIVMEGSQLTKNQHDYLNMIHQVVADGLSLMRNLVDYRNITYRKSELVPEKINLSSFVESSVKSIASLASKKDLTFVCDIYPQIEIVTDHVCVSRVIENVLTNAVKFSPRKKQIYVSVKPPADGFVSVHIKDQAGGLSADDVAKLFRKFQKLTAQPTGGETSTGLGLYIAKTMIQKIGGEIQCISEEGLGCAFIMKFLVTGKFKNNT